MQKLKDKSWSELGLFGGPLDVGPDIVEDVLKIASDLGEDVAVYPNPFYKWTGQENPNGNNEKLTLLDGGLADENIPLEPLLQPERAVDAIFAFDNSADSPQKWPKGISLYTTYQKSLNLSQKYDIPETMPPVPPREGFVNDDLNKRPVFFGCDIPTLPTIIYIPNAPWSHWSNHSTFQLAYGLNETLALIDNGRRSLELNGTVPDWGLCLTCAMINNAVLQSGRPHEDKCKGCLNRWCWNGVVNATEGKATEYQAMGQFPEFPQDPKADGSKGRDGRGVL
jgi:lysophospholipase